MTIGRAAGVKTCDDCEREYPGPAYYTFLESQCVVINAGAANDQPVVHAGCTGNLCADCAGSDIEPDRADDPRRVTR